MELGHLNRVRFKGDTEGAAALRADDDLQEHLANFENDPLTDSARKELLANAVRVDGDILPDLGRTIGDIHDRAGIEEEMECYVYADPYINAGVLRGSERLFVLLSSAAIEKLDGNELEFVIGHEIGHVVYDHFAIPVRYILSSDTRIPPRLAMDLLSWQRQSEISADRAGLLCCGSLEVAANAFFKVLSGLSLPQLTVNPIRFAAQFDQLREEIFREGAEEMAAMTHPLSPLRMKAMSLFWESDATRELLTDAPGGRSAASCDQEIEDLLAYMDPRGRRGDARVDPMLEPFLTWGGLIIAASDKQICQTELTALASVVGQHNVDKALDEARTLEHYRERLQAALDQRRHPLSALDINRVFVCLIAIARADGKVDSAEVESLHALAEKFGIARSYVDGLLEEF